MEESTIDRKGSQYPEKWDADKEGGTMTYTPPWGKAKFKFKMPDVIDAGGAKIEFGVKATAIKGSRFAPSMNMVGDIEFDKNASVYPLAESEQTEEENKTITLTPRKDSDDTKSV